MKKSRKIMAGCATVASVALLARRPVRLRSARRADSRNGRRGNARGRR